MAGGELSEKQESFCREYIVDFNANAAALRAGYAESSARQQGCKLLTNDNISDRISELSKKVVKKHDVTIERIIQEYSNIAFLDPIEVFKEDGSLKPLADMTESARRALSGIKIRSIGDGSGGLVDITEVKIIDKRTALADLGKHLGMFIERIDHTTKGESLNDGPSEEAKKKARDAIKSGVENED